MGTAPMAVEAKPPVKLRHELKYSIDPQDDFLLASRLRKLFQHDTNAGSHGSYRVSSLYFDTPYDKALRQKIDGVDRREKFRLRYYGEDPSFLRLEKKFKVNGLCGKRSATLCKEEAEAVLSGEIDFLLEREDPLLTEFYSKLRGQLLAPKTVVTYDREAFSYPPGNVRITIDRALRAGLNCRNFLDPGLYHTPMSDGLAVLEIKYDEFLPELVCMAVQVPNRQASACSKYAVCRRYD